MSPTCTPKYSRASQRCSGYGASAVMFNGDLNTGLTLRTARLRDIRELFMDTGVGARGYSIIQQGMIAKIVQAVAGATSFDLLGVDYDATPVRAAVVADDVVIDLQLAPRTTARKP